MKKYDIVIIGGGIIGGSIAYDLAKFNLNIVVLEKNAKLADETSRGNSGVIHGGFDPTPGKINARLNLLGLNLWKTEIFPHLTFPRAQIDSLIIAFNSEEMEHIHKLYKNGLINGVRKEDLAILNREQLLKREPQLNPEVYGALLCTSSWAIEPVEASLALFGAAKQNGVVINHNHEVTNIEETNNGFIITINNDQNNQIIATNVINAAGHYADIIAKLAKQSDFNLVARRGQYRILAHSQSKLVKAIYFMVPTIHGKGVVVAPLLDGRVLVGPTAEDNIPKDETRLVTQKMYDLIGKIGHRIIPSLDLSKTEMTLSGSRPIDPVTDDFIINYGKNHHFINVAGMKSPALSSAPAIALEVRKLLQGNGTKLTLKPIFHPRFEVIY